jgi:cell division protein FtsI/penicillin-binding protein 2
MRRKYLSYLLVILLLAVCAVPSMAVQSRKKSRKGAKAKTAAVAKKGKKKKKSRRYSNGRWTEPTYADSGAGDLLEGEDQEVRAAAVSALGPLNGTVVVADPYTGRVLTIVNQRLALQSGFQPCSTIKLVASLAGLSEGLVDRTTRVRLYGRTAMTMDEALAHSNNPYFAQLGVKLGYDRVSYYGRLFGLGEKAGLDIEGEQPGIWPSEPPVNGGVGMMMSFGSGISITPLELTALLGAIANGGTLYYLQRPRTAAEMAQFAPRVKRQLDIAQWIPEIRPGMMGAVDHGTARRANYDPAEPIMGKTGTCTDERQRGVHLGWFGSFNEVGGKKLVVVVLLTGGRPINGPVASGVAGQVYKNLSEKNYWVKLRTIPPTALMSTGMCCMAR